MPAINGASASNITTNTSEGMEKPGTVKAWGNATIPTGWLELIGQVVARATYPQLFAIFGTTFNTGGEAGTDFRLPNGQGRGLIGVGTYSDPVVGSITRTLGQLVGAAEHQLLTTEMPSHTHNMPHTHVMGDHTHGMNHRHLMFHPVAFPASGTAANVQTYGGTYQFASRGNEVTSGDQKYTMAGVNGDPTLAVGGQGVTSIPVRYELSVPDYKLNTDLGGGSTSTGNPSNPATGSTGAVVPRHNNMQPSLALKLIVKT